MDLHQLVLFGTQPPPTKMHVNNLVDITLEEIITAGKVTNSYQLFVLGYLSEFFKQGYTSVNLQLNAPTMYGVGATTQEVHEAMEALSAAEQVKLATYLLDCIRAGESALHDRSMNVIDWMKFVLARQK
jgi:hypothetical protein